MQVPTKRAASICALYAALSVLMCAPLFEQPNGVGHFDWDQHLFCYASVLKSIIEYAQWPFWNPWYCGGNVLWQNPQVALFSPAYPLALVLSLPLAMKMNIVLHYWIGFIGMHLLLRRVVHVRSMPLVIYLGCVFVAGGALALHVAEGHSTMLPALYLPLQLFWFCRAMSGGTMRDPLLAAAVAAPTGLNGGPHAVWGCRLAWRQGGCAPCRGDISARSLPRRAWADCNGSRDFGYEAGTRSASRSLERSPWGGGCMTCDGMSVALAEVRAS